MYNQHLVYCILPPHILREIAQNGSPAQRAMALRAITAAEQVRTQRRTIQAAWCAHA